MDRRLERLGGAQRRTASACNVLQYVFFTAFGIFCLAQVAIGLYAAFPPEGFIYVGPDNCLLLIPIFCNVLSGALALLFLGTLFRKIGRETSPFGGSSPRQLVCIGTLLLIGFIAGALIDPGTQIGAVGENAAMAIDFESATDSMTLDIRSLLESVACFALAAIFKYGTLLQNEADDLV